MTTDEKPTLVRQDQKGVNQYADLCKVYQDTKDIPVYRLLEIPTFMNLIASHISDHSDIVDLACGGGYFTRKIKALTGGIVVGVDISPEMVNFSRAQGGGCDYVVGDCCNGFRMDVKFDLVSSSHLLHYSHERDMLLGFCKTAYGLLKPGGCWVGVNVYPFTKHTQQLELLSKYGVKCVPEETDKGMLRNGSKMRATIKDERVMVDIYYWSPEDYEWAFRMAGFKEFKWIPLELEGDVEDLDFWMDWFKGPLTSCFKAIKPDIDDSHCI